MKSTQNQDVTLFNASGPPLNAPPLVARSSLCAWRASDWSGTKVRAELPVEKDVQADLNLLKIVDTALC